MVADGGTYLRVMVRGKDERRFPLDSDTVAARCGCAAQAESVVR